jgi:hypothetical protein
MSKKSIFYTLIVICVLSFEAQSAVTEVNGCNLKKGASMEDITAMSVKMNELMDSDGYGEHRFGQLVMQPYVEQTEKSEFDFYYLNYWGNYEIFGNDMHEWFDLEKGKQWSSELSKMVDCRTLNIFDTIVTRVYPGD